MNGAMTVIGLVTLMASTQAQHAPPEQPEPIGPLPSPRQLAWQDMEFTGFIHFGPNTFTDREWGHGDEPEGVFNPTALDARQWVQVMKDAGMKGVVITAKHHDGFCLWPTEFSAHSVRRSPWREGRGDVLAELSTACKEAGLKFGVYLSPWDRNNPLYGTGEAYNECFRNQLREVLTKYGPIHEVWFDGACGEGPNGKRQVYDFPSFWGVVRELQPEAVIFSDIGPDIRWVGNESGWAGETCWAMLKVAGHGIGSDNPPSTTSLNEGDEDGEAWIPAECDVSIRPGWFYHADQDNAVKTPQQLFDLYERSVGHNANFHLNLPLDRRGLVHENDVAALRGLRTIIADTYGPGTDIVTEWAALPSGNEFIATLDPASSFDRVVLAELIAQGQRVKSFRLSVPESDGSWRTIGAGTTIGHKRIVPVPLTTASKLRLEILDSRAAPLIRQFSAHQVRGDGAHIPIPSPGASAPQNAPGLSNVVAFSDGLLSGSAPHGLAGFKTLASWGVRTIISVDGAEPDAAAARGCGLRTIHLPIGYSGFDVARTQQLTRAVRDGLRDGAVYLHCHHGKHRSAAAAAAVLVSLGAMTPSEAQGRMEVSGTSHAYSELYLCVARALPVDDQALDDIDGRFAESVTPTEFVQAMLEANDALDRLRHGPPAAADAGAVADLMRALTVTEQSRSVVPEFGALLARSAQSAAAVEALLVQARGATATDAGALDAAIALVSASCQDCHSRYRD